MLFIVPPSRRGGLPLSADVLCAQEPPHRQSHGSACVIARTPATRYFSVPRFTDLPDEAGAVLRDAAGDDKGEVTMAVQVAPRPTLLPAEESPASPAIVEARRVDKIYDTGQLQVHALREVTFSVPSGEMVAIMGPSGSGKTTLLNCLSGLDRIDGGEVLIEGVELGSMSDEQRTDYRARRMGFVFQFYNLMPVLTAVENVELPLLVSRAPAKEARRKALEALELVGLTQRAAHVPDELSGGQRQRVTIARALVNDPAIVWADEPTGDLDSENADEIVALMRRLNRERGLTFLIVTHDIGVGRATDRIVRMVDGRIVDEQLLGVMS
jgi:putative ABC transport system ATP-binding protein